MYFHIGLSKRLWKISIFPIRLWLFSFQQAYKIRMGNGFTKMALDNLGKLKFDSKWYTYQFVKQKQRISLREAWGEFLSFTVFGLTFNTVYLLYILFFFKINLYLF